MFSKLFGCFKKGKSLKLTEINDERVSGQMGVDQSTLAPENQPKAEEVRTGVFRRIFTRSRRSKDNEVLGYEKRYLKKFLRHQNVYVSGMTLQEMRRAKRLLLEPENRKNFCLHCCHCFGCNCREDLKDATDNKKVKQVTFAEMLPTTEESKASEGGECSYVKTAAMAKKELESNENQEAPAKMKDVAGNHSAPKAIRELEETAKPSDAVDATEKPTITDTTPDDDLETSVKEKITMTSAIPPEELAVEKEKECTIATKTTVDNVNHETGKTPCELQSSEAQQSNQSSEYDESKEKVQSQSDEESLMQANENQLATAEDLQKQTTNDAYVEATPTAMFNDNLEMVEIDEEIKISEGECSSLDITTKKENITVQSAESPLKQSTEESAECSVQEKDEANGKIQSQPVEIILDKTDKMIPAEMERNNGLHALCSNGLNRRWRFYLFLVEAMTPLRTLRWHNQIQRFSC